MLNIKKWAVAAAAGLLGCQLAVMAGDPWILLNGDFRYSGACRALLQKWGVAYGTGNEAKLSEPDVFKQEPRTLFLTQGGNDPVILYQALDLLPGKYRLTVHLTQDSSNVYVSAGKNPQTVLSAAEKTTHAVELDHPEGGAFRVHLVTAEKGTAGIVSAGMELLDVYGTAVPVQDGRHFSTIVLPENPTEPERFAAWEMAKLCFKVTGAAPVISQTAGEGGAFLLGHAATLKVAEKAGSDTYLYGLDADGNLNLTGNSDRATLYAVYRYFNSQGCSWIIPGENGETIPKRQELTLPKEVVSQTPAYSVRGYMLPPMIFQRADNGWVMFDHHDCCDWALRNGLNALWSAGRETLYMDDWRGGSQRQTLNHSWHKFLLDDHPEWWPLVNGKRKKLHESGRFNQPCTSSREMRDYAVEHICQFFDEHPEYQRFSLTAEDEPCDWCECEACKAQDTSDDKNVKTDRSLNFVTFVAKRLAKRHPDKFLQTCGYGSNREAPKREKIPDNVVVEWCFHLVPDGTFIDKLTSDRLAGWRKAGMKRLHIYDYDNYLYPDTTWSGLRASFEELVELNRKYGAVEYLPESWSTLYGNPLMMQLRRDALWGAGKKDFEALVRTHCAEYFGAAADVMSSYYAALDKAFMKGHKEVKKRPVKDTNIIYLPQLTMDDMRGTDHFLEEAMQLAGDDTVLQRRIAYVRFSHELSKLSIQANQKVNRQKDVETTAAAFKLAKSLADTYRIPLANQMAVSQLEFFYAPPLIDKNLQELPVEGWRFCTDPEKKGLTEEWFKSSHPDWKTIRVDKDWTEQGIDYHGAAWYEVDFKVAKSLKSDRLAFHFGAVDGRAHIYLDGVKIGEQLEDPGKMWQLPYAIPCAELSKGRHRLTVRVEKNMFGAGIWKPVSIVKLEAEKAAEPTEKNVEWVQ